MIKLTKETERVLLAVRDESLSIRNVPDQATLRSQRLVYASVDGFRLTPLGEEIAQMAGAT